MFSGYVIGGKMKEFLQEIFEGVAVPIIIIYIIIGIGYGIAWLLHFILVL